ncbi:MAG: response regulator, partial [Magnetococcales bacterium]|nr:response regulator [Magnetococcales bacterium]
LDFSKIEAGKMEMEEVPFYLNDVMDHLTNLISVKVREKELELFMVVAPTVPDGLLGDALRLGQVLTNLANNAVKFTEKGEIVIRVDLLESHYDKVTLQFSVSDSGIGMSKDQVGKLFRSFSQADASTTRKFGGTGLGLTICKQLTEMMGGTILVESEPGVGSSFVFTAQFGLAHDARSHDQYPIPDLRGLHVLVVDDSPMAREIIQQMAQNLTFRAETAPRGDDALKLIRLADQSGEPYELIYMDWKMPIMDGSAVIRQIQSDPSLKTVPKVVMVTAYDRDEAIRETEDLQVADVLTKPVTASSLLNSAMIAMGHEGQGAVGGKQDGELGLEIMQQFQGAKILLVEDNEVNQQVATELLEMANLSVTLTINGQEAVAAVDKTKFDAILMDIQMPVMDGYTATREIRKIFAFDDLPIIAMTANALVGDREKCLDAGMNDHVAKPINPKEMFAILARWIKPGKREFSEKLMTATANTLADEIGTLPELPGIDTKNGLKRVGGRVSSYKKLLAKFVGNQQQSMVEIQQALDAQDLETALRLAHTLKGVSGTIGATQLQQAAAELEALFNAGNKDNARKLLPGVAQLLDETIATLQLALSKNDAQTQSKNEKEGQLPKDFFAKLQEIVAQAEQYSSKAVDLLDDLIAEVTDPTSQIPLKKAGAALASYDFETAVTVIKEMLAGHDKNATK